MVGILAVVLILAVAAVSALMLRLPQIVSRAPVATLLWTALGLFALALAIASIFLWFLAGHFKDIAREHRRVHSILRPAAESPSSGGFSPREQWHLIVLLIALPALALLLYSSIHGLFPSAPSWMPVAVVWIAGVIVTVWAWRKQHGASARVGIRQPALWRSLVNLGLCFALFLLVTHFDPRWLTPYIRPGTLLVLLTLLCLSLPFLVWVLGFVPLWWIWRALARVDYRTALRRCDLLLRIRPDDAGLRFSRGTALLFAGRYLEAERALRESIELGEAGAARSQSVALANVADAVMLQGRYDEAIQNYESAAAIDPGWGRPYSGLAEAYLWRDVEPERALALLDRALDRKLHSWASRNLDRHVMAQTYADRAWALALLGRAAEAQADIDRAFRAVRSRFRPGLASTHYRAGRTYLALRDEAQADEHFRRARELDSGSAGIQAAQMLRGRR